MNKPKILFLCTGNSCRSQMAEGFARVLKRNVIDAWSAGVEPHGLNQLAVKVMAESGVDISHQQSKPLDELRDIPFDYVVTVCDHANQTCPSFSTKAKRLHVGFDDPPALAKDATSEADAIRHFRRVRDEIMRWVQTLPASLSGTLSRSEETR